MSSCLIYDSLVGDVPGGHVRVTRIVAVCPGVTESRHCTGVPQFRHTDTVRCEQIIFGELAFTCF